MSYDYILQPGPGILQFVQAYGGAYNADNILKITIDGEVWREYSGLSGDERVREKGWDRVDDDKDHDAGIVTLMPFKKFSKQLKVEIYNAKKRHESSVRVNFLTPREI